MPVPVIVPDKVSITLKIDLHRPHEQERFAVIEMEVPTKDLDFVTQLLNGKTAKFFVRGTGE